MKDYILYQNLLKEVEAGNVTTWRTGDLVLFKYTNDCMIHSRWNEVNRKARGIIFRTDGTIVARPFEKFFNLGEVEATKIENLPWHEEVEIFEKLDGSCGIGYYMNGWKLATPGSMESDQAIEGTRILNDGARYRDFLTGWYMHEHYKLEHLPQSCTPVFEIIYPDNRIVVDYRGHTLLSLLAIFELNGEEWHPKRVDQIAKQCGFQRPRRYNLDLRSEIPFEDNAEGYVARFASGLRVKVKSPAYVRVHRLLNYMSPKGVIELIRGREYGVTLLSLPKWIQQDFDDIRAYVQQIHDKLRLQVADLAIHVPEGDRKAKALWIIANTPKELTGCVFATIDGHDIKDKLWRIVLEKVKDERTKTLPVD